MKNYVIDTDTARKKLGFVLGNSKEINIIIFVKIQGKILKLML